MNDALLFLAVLLAYVVGIVLLMMYAVTGAEWSGGIGALFVVGAAIVTARKARGE